MDAYSYVVTWDQDPADRPDLSAMRRLASANGVPLVFKILVSQEASLTEAGATRGSGSNSATGTLLRPLVGVTGDFHAGRDKLLGFLDELVWRGLFNPEELNRETAGLVGSLNDIASDARWVTLGIDPSARAGGNVWAGMQMAQAVLEEVGDIDSVMARALADLEALHASGQVVRMRELLGLDVIHRLVRRSEAAKPAPDPDAKPKIRVVPRPLGVTVICAVSIAAGALLAVFSLAALGAAGADARTAAVLGWVAFVSLVLSVAGVVLAVMVLRGSAMARRLFAIVTAVGILLDVIAFLTGQGSVSTGVNVALSVAYLVVLYSDTANAYFEYKSAVRR